MSELINNDHTLSRRDVLRRGGLLAGTALLSGSLLSQANAQTATTDPATPTTDPAMAPADPNAAPAAPTMTGDAGDIEILNYALLLEYLEADYYTRSVNAHTARPYLLPRYVPLATELRDHEVAHVQALTQTITQLGGTPITSPQFQFPAEAFISPVFWNSFAQTLEETGVSAYLGQAPRLKSKELLKAAASIYGVEARHAAIIRFTGAANPSGKIQEHPLSMDEVKQLVAPYIVGGLPGVEPSSDPAMAPATGPGSLPQNVPPLQQQPAGGMQ